jgi:hypothetical protein
VCLFRSLLTHIFLLLLIFVDAFIKCRCNKSHFYHAFCKCHCARSQERGVKKGFLRNVNLPLTNLLLLTLMTMTRQRRLFQFRLCLASILLTTNPVIYLRRLHTRHSNATVSVNGGKKLRGDIRHCQKAEPLSLRKDTARQVRIEIIMPKSSNSYLE